MNIIPSYLLFTLTTAPKNKRSYSKRSEGSTLISRLFDSLAVGIQGYESKAILKIRKWF